jgi:replicative DNA helicase
MALFDIKAGKKNSGKDSSIIKISAVKLVNLIQYAGYDHTLITAKNRRNLKKLVDMIDVEATFSDSETNQAHRILFLRELVNQVSLGSLTTIESIRDHFNTEFANKTISQEIVNECMAYVEDLSSPEFTMSDEEILGLNQYVEDKLKYSYLYSSLNSLSELKTRLLLDKESTRDINDFGEKIVADIYKNMRAVKSQSEFEANDIDFSSDDSLTSIDKLLVELQNPSNKLITGYQAFNNMINGGFEGSRVYALYGTLKSFKSGAMLNMALTVCKYNTNVKLKDPRKKPVVVYLTQENDIKETLERIYTHITGKDLSTANINGKELYELIDDSISKETGIGFKIIYKPSKSVNTDYLYDIYDDLNAEGKECIFMVQDYIARMRSVENYQETRFELGAIVDEMSIFAKQMKIPVLTAAQLNRGEVDKRELMESNNRNDIANAMSGSGLSESLMIAQNLDAAIIVAREKVMTTDPVTNEPEQHTYAGFKLVMSRFREQQVSESESKTDAYRMRKYFAMPIDGGFRIREDIGTEIEGIPSISEKYGNGPSKEVIQKATSSQNSSLLKSFISDNNSPMSNNNKSFSGFNKEKQITDDDMNF